MKLYSHYKKNMILPTTTQNWNNYEINDFLLYSYRSTKYDAGNFPSNLHYHDYFELMVIEEGNIRYICESEIYYPEKGDIILIPPGKFHMSAINEKTTQYSRHVFYFYPQAFDTYKCSSLNGFAGTDVKMITFSDHNRKQEVISLLKDIASTLPDSTKYPLSLSYIINFFYLLNQKDVLLTADYVYLPDNIHNIKKYIDENYASIDSVSQVAEHFFYSREHASKLFKKHFDITISDYILQRRILESQRLISNGTPVTKAAYAVGFNSMSAFIRAFRKINNMTPSQYRNSKS